MESWHRPGSSPRRLGLLFLAIAALLMLFAGPPAAVQAQEPAWDGIVPPELDEGAKYRILFVTRTQRNAASEDIADYNSFVQGVADAATGNPFAGVGSPSRRSVPPATWMLAATR